MQRSTKAVLIAAGLTVTSMLGAGLFYAGFRQSGIANASPEPGLVAEVPAGASTLIYADLAAIRASTFYQQRPDKGPIALPDHNYADFVQSTGFDFEKDLDRVVVASWEADPAQGQNKPDQRKTLVIADGCFDRQKIHDYAKCERGSWITREGGTFFCFLPIIPRASPGQPAGAGGPDCRSGRLGLPCELFWTIIGSPSWKDPASLSS